MTETKRKKGFLTALSMAIKKDPTTSIKEHANELKVHRKIVRTTIKEDLSLDINSLDYAIWNVTENKANATPHTYIDSFRTVYWGVMGLNVGRIYFDSMKIVLKVCWYNNWKKKWWPYWVNLHWLSSCFVVYFWKIKLNLFL